MSKTRQGVDEKPNEKNTQPGTEQTTTGSFDQRLGARGQTDYTPGRESSREFPRRSTSLRERGEQYSQYNRSYESPSRAGGNVPVRDYRSEPAPRYRDREFGGDPYPRDPGDRERLRERSGRYQESSRRDDYENDYSRYGGRGHEGRRPQVSPYDTQGRGYETRTGSGRGEQHDREDARSSSYDSERSYDPFRRKSVTNRAESFEDYEPARVRSREPRERDEYDYDDRRDRGRESNYLRCADIMTKDITCCSPQTSLREVADKMEDDNVGSIPVVDNGRLVGIVTDRDIVCRVLAEGRDTRSAVAADAMSEDLVICTTEHTVLEAIQKMGQHQVRRIPVCDLNGRLRGMIAMADIALEAERDRELAEALEQISNPTPRQSRKR